MTKQYNYRDDFEMVYLRHEYLSKIKYIDPAWIEHNKPIVNTTAIKMFNKLKPNFQVVGFDVEDLKSITNIYMVAYMGLYSLENNKKARDVFVRKYKTRTNQNPTQKDFVRAERNNLINFLRQRLQHCAKLCERKSRNIKVGREKRGIFAETEGSVPASHELIISEYKRLGYRKVTQKEFKEAKAQSRIDGLNEIVDKNGFKILEIQILSNGITIEDYALITQEHHNNIYYNNPECMMLDYEESVELESYRNKFNNLDIEGQIDKLYSFIYDHKGQPHYKGALKEARRKITELKKNKKS